MKTTFFYILFALAGCCANAQNVNLLWAKQMGGTNDDYGNSIAVDATGNIYTTGRFSGTADFDPGIDTYYLTSLGGEDAFVAKLDAIGNLIWAKQMGGANTTRGHAIAVDAIGNVHLTGFFNGTTDFDPGLEVYNLGTTGSTDIFVSKLDASGNFLWAKNFGSINSDEGSSIAVDDDGNVYTTGMFQSTVDFDPGNGVNNLTSFGDIDIFVSKLDASGNFIWAKQMGSVGPNGTDWGHSIAVDATGNVYTTGIFSGIADFDPSTENYYLSVGSGTLNHINTFISKLDASGSFLWAKQFSGPFYEISGSIFIDIAGNVYTTGVFSSTVDFDPGIGVFELTSANYDVFIAKLSASGNFLWAKQVGGADNDIANSIFVDIDGNVYTTGSFQSTADFDPNGGANIMESAGGDDIFVLKLDTSGSFLWAKQIGGTGNDVARPIVVDVDGNVHIAGLFQGAADFDPNTGIYDLTSAGANDIFVAKFAQVDPCAAVGIATQPTNQLATIGGTATFSVEATGTPPFTYQWRKNGVDISGANDATYTTPGLALADDGNTYSCHVTNCEGSYSATSDEATLSICTAPTTQAKNIAFTSVCGNIMTLSWANGNGTKRIVKLNTSNSFTAPVNSTDPAANATYAGSGEQVVYNGSANTVTVSGLSGSTTYWFRVYEANCSGNGSAYNTATANQNPRSRKTESNISVTITKKDVKCNGGSDGEATANANGGSSGKTYLWSTGATTNKITGQSAGTYSVTVTDNQGCTGTATITIASPPELSATVGVAPNNGAYSATIAATGGTPPYKYRRRLVGEGWKNWQNSNVFSNLSEGVYTFEVKDGNDCTFLLSESAGVAGDCPYPIVLVHGWLGDETTWDDLYENSYFKHIWGGHWSGLNFKSVNNAYISTKLEGEDGELGTIDDDVLVSFNNQSNNLANGCIYTIDMNNFWNQNIDTPQIISGDNTPPGWSRSNASAIKKGGYVLKKAIQEILDTTQKTKVILVGHSMGGLMCREYLQRTEGGIHKWWQNQNEDGHKVVKLFTIGTPHLGSIKGSQANDPIQEMLGLDLHAEAVRDLRWKYVDQGCSPNDQAGIYLFGGDEMNLGQDCYYNYDVDCDGDSTSDNVIGINDAYTGSLDNDEMRLPLNVRYTYYVGNHNHDECQGFGSGGDYIVDDKRQWLFSYGDGGTCNFINGISFPEPNDGEYYRLSDRFTSSNVRHTDRIPLTYEPTEMEDIKFLVRGLDEGDFPKFAWEVNPDVKYSGMAQIRPEKTPPNSNTNAYSPGGSNNRMVDGDWFKVYLPTPNKKIKVTLKAQTCTGVRLDIYSTFPGDYSNSESPHFWAKNVPAGQNSVTTPFLTTTGMYYFRITHFLENTTNQSTCPYFVLENAWKVPYTFTVTFLPSENNLQNESEIERGTYANELIIGEIRPQPATSEFSLDIFNPSENLKATFRLFIPFGQPVFERSETLTSGDNTLSFPTENLLPGMYYLTVQAGDVKKTLKIMKM